MNVIQVSCKDANWKALLKQALQAGSDVDLENFDYTLHGDSCETLAMSHRKILTIDIGKQRGVFRADINRKGR